MPIDRKHIFNLLNAIKHECDFWEKLVIGGSSAAVLRKECQEANDLDIIQHNVGEYYIVNQPYERRLWSKYYPDLKIDWHYSNEKYPIGYPPCFRKVIQAITYVDTTHYVMIDDWKVITKYGAGLINWIHHFLDYGYNIHKTIDPLSVDEEEFKKIFDNHGYNILKWKVETNRLLLVGT